MAAKKTMLVANQHKEKIVEAELLVVFIAEVGGEKFSFAVTRLPSEDRPSVTDVESGARVERISWTETAAAQGDWKLAGKAALRRVIERVGEARVASALRTAGAKKP